MIRSHTTPERRYGPLLWFVPALVACVFSPAFTAEDEKAEKTKKPTAASSPDKYVKDLDALIREPGARKRLGRACKAR